MFQEVFDTYSWSDTTDRILSKTEGDVKRALARSKRTLEDFQALISPAAVPFLEEMAAMSHALTINRFGHTMQLYAPLYLSNECQNICTYCAFSVDNTIKRKTLSDAEILSEAAVLKAWGYDHVLLVTGESAQVGVDYIRRAIRLLRPHFAQISMEVQPLDQVDYSALAQEGLTTVLVYQETYNREKYKVHHPKGKKSNFNYRLDTPDRLGAAEMHKVGLGVLIGLEDWRTDAFFSALHLEYMEKRYWKTKYSISFPRLRPIETEDKSGHSTKKEFHAFMSDAEFVQLISAFRLFDPEVELSLSTRETEHFRNHAIKLGFTSMSAGSKTNPGGYTSSTESLEQFEISDERSPAEIAQMLHQNGYEPVWKDWDKSLTALA
jgi:2-iminoacetate synthase